MWNDDNYWLIKENSPEAPNKFIPTIDFECEQSAWTELEKYRTQYRAGWKGHIVKLFQVVNGKEIFMSQVRMTKGV